MPGIAHVVKHGRCVAGNLREQRKCYRRSLWGACSFLWILPSAFHLALFRDGNLIISSARDNALPAFLSKTFPNICRKTVSITHKLDSTYAVTRRSHPSCHKRVILHKSSTGPHNKPICVHVDSRRDFMIYQTQASNTLRNDLNLQNMI